MKWAIQAGWEDAAHIDEKSREEMAASYMPFEREARTRGIPSLGSGAIYPVPESDFVIAPFQFPLWFKHFYAMDVGWNRTAALWGAVDPENGTLYWYDEHYRGQAEPPIHAAAIRARGTWIPGVIDPASRASNQKDGDALFSQYQNLGLTLVKAENAVEAGLYAVWSMKSSGRLKVFNTLQNYLAEHRIYRRDEKGRVVKDKDHCMDCERYGVASGITIAAQRPADQWPGHAGALPISKSRHTSDYSPMASLWDPRPQQPQGGQRPNSWMPFKG